MLICQSSRDTRLKTVKSFHTVLIQCLRWWFGFHGPTINWSSTSGTLQLDSILSCQLSVFGMEPLTDRMDGPPLWLFYISFQVQSEEAPENDQRWSVVFMDLPLHSSMICLIVDLFLHLGWEPWDTKPFSDVFLDNDAVPRNTHYPIQCLVFICCHFMAYTRSIEKMVLSVRVAKDDLDAKQIHPHLSFP